MPAKLRRIPPPESKNARLRRLRYHLLWMLTEVKPQPDEPLLEARKIIVKRLGELYDTGEFDTTVRQLYVAITNYDQYCRNFNFTHDSAEAEDYRQVGELFGRWLAAYGRFVDVAVGDWARKYLVEALMLKGPDDPGTFAAFFQGQAESKSTFPDLWSSIPLIEEQWRSGPVPKTFPSPQAIADAMAAARPQPPRLRSKSWFESERQYANTVEQAQNAYLVARRNYQRKLGFVKPLRKPALQTHMRWLAKYIVLGGSMRKIANNDKVHTAVKDALDKLTPLLGVQLSWEKEN